MNLKNYRRIPETLREADAVGAPDGVFASRCPRFRIGRLALRFFAFTVVGLLSVVTLMAAESPITKIAAGYYHSLFIKADGSLWVMGANPYGELGNGTNTATNRPVQILTNGVSAIS